MCVCVCLGVGTDYLTQNAVRALSQRANKVKHLCRDADQERQCDYRAVK